MENTNNLVSLPEIENRILTLRGMQVMLDSHLAELYNVETKQLNRAVKRNLERFPENYCFQIDKQEHESLIYQIRTSSRCQIGTLNDLENLMRQIGTSNLEHGGWRYLPSVFIEQDLSEKCVAFSLMEDKSLITKLLNKI